MDQRFGLRMIDSQPFPDGFFLIVITLHQRFAGDIIPAFDFRRIEFDVIGAPRGRMDATTANCSSRFP